MPVSGVLLDTLAAFAFVAARFVSGIQRPIGILKFKLFFDYFDGGVVVFVERIGSNIGSIEPGRGFFCATKFFKYGAVSTKERRAVAEGLRGVELRNLQFNKCFFGLSEVESSTRHGDGEFYLHAGRQGAATHRASQFQCALGPPKAAFAVDHHRKLVVATRYPSVGAQFAQCECVVLCCIGSDRECFAHHTDTSGTTCGRNRVLVGKLRIVFDELRNHHKVQGYAFSVFLAQGLQLIEGNAVEHFGRDALGNLGCLMKGTD